MWNSTKEPVLKEETYLISAVQQPNNILSMSWSIGSFNIPPWKDIELRGGGGEREEGQHLAHLI